ncbi:MAG: hypothetical protein ACE5G6_08640, partial [Terriglobia bacterium]
MKWFGKPGSIWDMGPRFPLLDKNRQSSIPGLYLAGDITGTPDIKAAINAGADVARHLLSQDLACRPPCDAHILILGGGPAGVSAALEFEKAYRERRGFGRLTPGAKAAGLATGETAGLKPGPDRTSAASAAPPKPYLLLEKKQLFTTIRNFAKCKPLFYASTGDPQVKGDLWWQEDGDGGAVRSCDLVEVWASQLEKYSLNARLGETVTDIQKTDKFRVVTDKRSYV